MGQAKMDGNGLMQRVREAHALVGNLAEEFVRMEEKYKEDFWNGSDFFDLTGGFLTSIKVMGFDIENDSLGEKLANAIRDNDVPGMSRYRFELMSNIKKLNGSKRSGYMFFIFWPRLHMALNAEQNA